MGRRSGGTIERSLLGSYCVRDSNSVYLRTQSRSTSHRDGTSPNSVHKIRNNLYLYTAIILGGLPGTTMPLFWGPMREHHAAVQTNHHRQIHTKNTIKVIALCFCVDLTLKTIYVVDKRSSKRYITN